MSVTLNFGASEKKAIKEVFDKFDPLETKTKFEEGRWKTLGCTVTLYSSGKLVVQGIKEEAVKKFILSQLVLEEDIVLGIDEVGRGENFGPLVIAGVLGDKNKLRELRDSKKTKDIKKKFEVVSANSRAIASVEFSPEQIDFERRKGVSLNELQIKAIKGINFALNPKSEWEVVVDGTSLAGCKGFTFVVKGDDTNPVVGAASIVAKHIRNSSKNNATRKTWKNS